MAETNRQKSLDPAASVIIPVYNKERYVARALDSVVAQSFEDFEVVVVDDGSTDGGPAVIRSFALNDARIRLLTQGNRGPGAARNRGVREARGELIAFLDADDEWREGFLQETVRLAEHYPQAGLIAANYASILRRGKRRVAVGDDVLRGFTEGLVERPFELWRRVYFVWTSAVLARKEALETVGGFHEDLPTGEDQHLWAKAMLHYPVVFTRKILALYHQDVDSSLTLDWVKRKQPPPFAFSRHFFPMPRPTRTSPDLLCDFLGFREKCLDEYLFLWAAAGRWRHVRRVAGEEGASLVAALWRHRAFLRPFFYANNLRRLLAFLGLAERGTRIHPA